MDADLAAWIELSLVPGLGGSALRSLLSAFGLPRHVFEASSAALARTVPEPLARAILQRDRAASVERALEWASAPRRTVITLSDDRYPRQLLEIPDPPALLYVHGDPVFLSATSLAVVGSRNATPQGIANAQAFARTLSGAGITVVSGLALGIDAAAHRGGLDGGAGSVAVLGTGADIVYPKKNQTLAEEITALGALVSEFPLGTPPLQPNFPRRNRLISGLTRGCLVVEAALPSGSMITARLAAEQGREVFAIPGSIHSPLSKGCHALIKQGAKLVESAQDVLEELGMSASPRAPDAAPAGPNLLAHMGFDPCDIDTLVARSGLTAEAVSAMLLQLELDGKVGSLSGGLYQRVS